MQAQRTSHREARRRIRLTGIVQGVGMRPFVYNLAQSLEITGYIQNTAEGVIIEVEGRDLDTFADKLVAGAPARCRIESFESKELVPRGYRDFVIRPSRNRRDDYALIPSDVATCRDCLAETLDPGDRRCGYPFTNCTACGPRYSIITGVPYDRPRTTMASFTMCPACEAEYSNPSDRRFHAQPNACPACGPQVTFVRGSVEHQGPEAMTAAVEALGSGAILAVKGLGGFHLACDAANREAVRRLRERKRRNNKPFALMVPDIGAARSLCEVKDAEARILDGPERPIVIAPRRPDAMVSPEVAPGNTTLGLMLPSTPLHHLLFSSPQGGDDRNRGFAALVMTSGNLAEEPIAVGNREAQAKLADVADAFLLHDRDIHMRVDDSIVRQVGGNIRMVRRSRGWVPQTIALNSPVPEVLGCGAELKNTLCLTKDRHAILSQHIGNLDNHESLDFFRETLTNLSRSFRVRPSVVAHDLHPDYLSTRFAASLDGVRRTAVQHHHAHVASCMAEHGLDQPVIGVAFDGTGYGPDGAVWGGEFLVADYIDFRRAAHLAYVPLPGGDRAVREPWRMAVSYLLRSGVSAAYAVASALGDRIDDESARVVLRLVERGLNAPPTSSAGRLFDAVSSLLGLRDVSTFEGEAAIVLEQLADGSCRACYPYTVGGPKAGSGPETVDMAPAIRAILADLADGVDNVAISAKFHNTVARLITEVCLRVSVQTGIRRVALTGGVFQNALLLERCLEQLGQEGLEVYAHQDVPTNDGGVSLGQAVIAAARAAEGRL